MDGKVQGSNNCFSTEIKQLSVESEKPYNEGNGNVGSSVSSILDYGVQKRTKSTTLSVVLFVLKNLIFYNSD